MPRPEGVQFTIEELITHLRGYEERHGITEIDLVTRYFVKEAGTHFVVEHMGLPPAEQEQLKRILSERCCLDEALAVMTIPARYLVQIIDGLPRQSQGMSVRGLEAVRVYRAAAQAMVIAAGDTSPGENDFPSPFDLESNGPYIAVRQEVIRDIVGIAIGVFNSQRFFAILNTPHRKGVFN